MSWGTLIMAKYKYLLVPLDNRDSDTAHGNYDTYVHYNFNWESIRCDASKNSNFYGVF